MTASSDTSSFKLSSGNLLSFISSHDSVGYLFLLIERFNNRNVIKNKKTVIKIISNTNMDVDNTIFFSTNVK